MREAFSMSHTAVEERILRSVLVARPSVLEPGCGRTTRLAGHRHRIRRLVGVDMDAELGRENISLDEFVPGDAAGPMPFEEGSFDIVYANFVIEHLARPAKAFREWRRMLAYGGSLVVTTSNANPVVRLYRSNTRDDLDRDLRSAGFGRRELAGARRSTLIAWYHAV
jgi:SAM-dependent methyltransferase